MLVNTPKTTQRYGFVLFAFLLLTSITTFSQTVTPWMTTGDKSKLLQQQATVSFGTNSGTNPSTVTVNAGTTYQSVDALGFCLTEGSAEVINSLAATQQSALLNELFNQSSGIGISAIRISIGASDLSSSDYSYDESPGDVNMNNFSLSGPDLTYLVPIIKKALAINPGLKILATPWTAPTWMKTNTTWVGGSLNTSYYAAYARYFVKYIQAMQGQGISIWAITPQNEPLNPNNNPSMSMSSTEEKNFINNNLGPALASAGLGGVKIIAYDHNCDNTAYPIDVCNNSSYVDGAAFHLYAGSISAMTTVKNATNKNVYFTEQFTSSTGSFSGDLGWHLQNVVNGSVNNWSKAVFEWNLANNSSMGPHTSGGCTTCLGAYTINSSTSYTRNVSYYIIGQLSKFVRPGALRISSSSTSSSLSVSAFKNPDGTIVALVYNSGASSTSMKLVSGTQALTYSIPAASAVTFKWTPGSGGGTPTGFPGYYNILARHSNKGLDVADNATTSGARLQQYDVTGGGGSNQRWSFTPVGNGNYYIKVKSTQMCMAPSAQGTVDGEKVQQRTCGSTSEFQWTVTDLGGGYYKITNGNSGKSLDVQDVSTANGANIQVWAYGGGLNQQWSFTQVETTASVRVEEAAQPELSTGRSLVIYPNPAHDHITVSGDARGLNHVEISALNGTVLLKKEFTGEERINIYSLAPGVYLMKIVTRSGTVYRKFSKQ
jgi:glucosylceramidase